MWTCSSSLIFSHAAFFPQGVLFCGQMHGGIFMELLQTFVMRSVACEHVCYELRRPVMSAAFGSPSSTVCAVWTCIMERIWLHFRACVRVVWLLQMFPTFKIKSWVAVIEFKPLINRNAPIDSEQEPGARGSWVSRVRESAALCSAALLTVAGKDVSVSGSDASPTSATQPHGLQLGGVRSAAGAGALEGLLEHRAERDEGVRTGCVAAVSFAAGQ